MADIRDRYILEVDTDRATRGIGASTTAIGGLGAGLARIGPLAGAAVAALGGFAAVSSIKGTIDDMDALAKSARLAGVAAGDEGAFRDFQVLAQAMNEAGVDAATFERGMLQLNTRLTQGIEGHKGYGEVVAKLGDSIRDSNGDLLQGADAMEAMINALNDGTISTEDFAKVVGGRAGPVIQQQFAELQDGAEGLAATLADVEANSNIVSEDAANQAEVFNDTLGRLGEAAGQLGTDIATALLPILVDLAEGALAILPSVIDGVKTAFSALSPIIEALLPVGQALFDLISALQPVFQLLFDILGPTAEVIGGALTLAIQGITTVIETVIGVIETLVERLGAIGEKVSEITGAVGNKMGEMKDSMVNGAKGAYDGVTNWFGQMYDEVVGNSIIPDMVNGVLGEFDDMSGGMVSRIADAIPGIIRTIGDVASEIGSRFESLTGVSLSNIQDQVSTLSSELGSRVSALASSVSSRLSGVVDSAKGILGGLGISNPFENFGGFFANGGTLPAGKFGIVGERGPELISGPANITPFDQMGGSQVIYNINAVDAKSFRDLLARDPGYIHALASKGAAKVPGRF
jgi:phage-related protein